MTIASVHEYASNINDDILRKAFWEEVERWDNVTSSRNAFYEENLLNQLLGQAKGRLRRKIMHEKDAYKLDIEKLFEKIDWVELHELQTLTDGYRCPIIIWADDGSLDLLSSGSWPNTDRYFFSMSTCGWGNVNVSLYAEGWATEKLDEYGHSTGTWIEDGTGREMTEEEVVGECIVDGDWSELYEHWKNDLRREHDDYIIIHT